MCIQDHTRVEDLEHDLERLQNQQRLILEQRDEHAQLQKYADEERTYRSAPLTKRIKW